MALVAFPAVAQSIEGIIDIQKDFEMVIDLDVESESQMESSLTVEGQKILFPIDQSLEDGRRQGNTEGGDTVVIVVDGYPVALKDVPLDQWFAPYVRDVAERGLISGYRSAKGVPLGLYGPADSVTVEQLAKLAVEAGKIDLSSCEGTLKNVSAVDRWSDDYVLCAETLNWAVYSDGSVDVTRPATRAEVVVTVLQAFGRKIGERKGSIFTDVDSSTEFGAAIETASEDHLVTGFTDAQGRSTRKFGPTNPVNRAEAAKIFSLAFQLY